MLKNLQNSDHLQVGLQWKLLSRQVDEIAPGVLPQVLKASLHAVKKMLQYVWPVKALEEANASLNPITLQFSDWNA